MPAREIVVTLRLSEGTTREQFRALKGALIDVKQEIAANNKALRDNKKEQDALSKAIKDAGVATEQQAIRERQLAQRREELKLVSADLSQSEGSLNAQFREARNEVSGLSDAHLRFRDKMAQATIEALKQQGVLGQLGARLEFVKNEQDRLNQEQAQGKITSEQLRIALDKLEQEERELVTQTTALNSKIDALAQQLKDGKITAEQFRAETQAINASVQQVGGAVNKGIADLKSYALGFVGVIAAAQATIRVIGSVANTIADFDQQLANIRALGAEFAGSIDRIGQAAIELGPKLGIAPVEALKGFEALAKAGLTTEQILSGGLESTLLLQAAGGMESVGEAAETTAAALTQFNLQGEEAGKVTDLLAKGSNIAQGNVSDFAAALNQSGLVASQFGLTIEETIGGLTAFAKAGLIGSDAGTSFRQALLRLQNPTEKAQKVMAQYGITVTNAAGEFLNLEEIAGQLKSQLANLTEEQRGAALATIFGQDAIRVANILYREGAEGVARFTQEVNESGFANEVAKTKLDSISGSAKKFGAAWDSMVLEVDSGNSVLSKGIRGLIDAYSEFLSIITGKNEFKNFQKEVEAIAKESGLAASGIFNSAAKAAEGQVGAFLSQLKEIEKEIGTLPPVEIKTNIQGLALFVKDEIEATQKKLANEEIAPKLAEAKIRALQILIEDKINPALEKQQEAIDKINNSTENLAGAQTRLNNQYRQAFAERERINTADEASIRASDALIKNIEDQAAKLGITLSRTGEVVEEAEVKVKNVSGSVADLNAQIDSLQQRQAQSTTSEQFETYQVQIDRLLQSVDLLTGKLSQDMVDAANAVPQVLETIPVSLPQPALVPAGFSDQQAFQAAIDLAQDFRSLDLENLEAFLALQNQLVQQYGEEKAGIINSLALQEMEAQLAVDSAKANAVQAAGQAITQLAKDGSAAAKLGLIVQKGAAIAQVLIADQLAQANAIAAATLAAATNPVLAAGGPPAILAFAAPTIAASKINTAAALAIIAAQTLAGFDEGGFIGNGFIQQGWGKRIRRNNGDNVMITARAGEVILNEDQQSVLERMMGGGIWHRLGVPNTSPDGGYASGGYVSSIPVKKQVNPGFATGPGGHQTHGTALVNLRAVDIENSAIRNVLAEVQPNVAVSEINKIQGRVRVTEDMSTA